MKRNAFIRIILWSATIVLLTGIMLTTMGLAGHSVSESPLETQAAIRVTTPTPVDSAGKEAQLIRDAIVYSSPDTQATELGTLGIDSRVQISLEEQVSGQGWAFITSPEKGWILMENVLTDPPAPTEDIPAETSVFVPSSSWLEEGTFSPDEVREIEIEWFTGEILIQPGNVENITVKEDGVTEDKYAMVLRRENDSLKIQFCEEKTYSFFGIHSTDMISKDLTITVPMDWICESLEIDAASATVEVNDMIIRDVDFDGASGTCEFENCVVSEIDIDTASGDVRFIGELNILDCDAASASVYAVLSNNPSRLDLDSMSGDLDITLPENAGFALSVDGMRTDFTSEFETTLKNGNYVCGDGSCRINVDAMSGDVTIRKGAPLEVEPILPTTPDATTTP